MDTNTYMGVNMSEREFIVWLSGFISGVGSSPTETHWKLLIDQLSKVDITDLSSGKSKQLLHDGTLYIIRDTKK
jgi:hypothetical protein